jgi:hypothetical protein
MTSQDNPAPRGGVRRDHFSGVMLVLIALYVGIANREYPIGTLQEPGPGFMPLVLAIFLGAMGLLITLWGLHSRPIATLQWTEARRAVIVLAACGVAAFALERIGYRLTVLAFMVFFLGVVERKHPIAVVLVSVGFAFASFYIVGDVLDVPLPRSPWGL